MTSLELAKLFHETYERLAPSFGYETRKETQEFNEESSNGKLMRAVCEEILSKLGMTGRANTFKPGDNLKPLKKDENANCC